MNPAESILALLKDDRFRIDNIYGNSSLKKSDSPLSSHWSPGKHVEFTLSVSASHILLSLCCFYSGNYIVIQKYTFLWKTLSHRR